MAGALIFFVVASPKLNGVMGRTFHIYSSFEIDSLVGLVQILSRIYEKHKFSL